MGITTSQQLQNYYDIFRDTEVAYTKDVLKTLCVDPRQIYIKCNGAQWPCIINSTSFLMARIIVGTKGGAFAAISKKDAAPVSLRFYFVQAQEQPISFFVTGRVSGISPYMNSNELAIVTISFTQRPPDDLIERVGSMLEANSNAIRRKEERIIITEETKRRLYVAKDETMVFIQNVPRRCILRDISFSGAKVILLGIEKFVQGKQAVLRIHFDEPDEVILLTGDVVKTSPIEGRAEIIFACLHFDESKVPMSYKIRINNYLTTVRKNILNAAQEEQKEEQKEANKEAIANRMAMGQTAPQPEAAAQTESESPKTEPESPLGVSLDSPETVEGAVSGEQASESQENTSQGPLDPPEENPAG